ncbi:hypothetical protein CBR_g10936 [Chara braunii]|uniref:BZIP transcription factor n=1 Tax=Chara braunii TaxID=69332 RepID=A0A388KPN9_CHABU|nr:hypothetical protein CBR_g10936 [Chara braunii]|eukprot:GBG71997.1 hypothetical protein CBR_g10936 [Chara braunii]
MASSSPGLGVGSLVSQVAAADIWSSKSLSTDFAFAPDASRDNVGDYDLAELDHPLHFALDDDPELGQEDGVATSASPCGKDRLTLVPSFDTSEESGKPLMGGGHGETKADSQLVEQHSQYNNAAVSASSVGVESPTGARLSSTHHAAFDLPSSRAGIDGVNSPSAAPMAVSGRLENWGEAQRMEPHSPRTDASGEMDAEMKAIEPRSPQSDSANTNGAVLPPSSRDRGEDNSKALRRLAQNREAARKSRLRKKAYVQQLESSRIRLQQLEAELQRARQQGVFPGVVPPTTHVPSVPSSLTNGLASNTLNPGAAAFDVEYARWQEEMHRHLCDLRAALQSRLADNDLRMLVDACIGHYDELFRLKSQAAKADVFHLVSGMWKTPAERCFMWMGGFRPSELLKILLPQIEPLSEQQLLNIYNLQHSSQQAEDTLSTAMGSLQQSLAETLTAGPLSASSSNVANYMGQMAMAMGKLGTLETFVCQADNLRQQTLQQMHRILTTRQSAKGLLAMGDYFARLRALSSLWGARPRE